MFETIGAEWARGVAVDEPTEDPEAERIIQAVLSLSSPEQLAAFIRERSSDLILYQVNLLAHAQAGVLAGGRDVERIGRVLIAIGLGSADVQAAGYFLVGYALPSLSAEASRHFELAAVAYRELQAPLLAELARLAAKLASFKLTRIQDDAAINGLLRAVADVGTVDAECQRRLAASMDRYVGLLRLAHDLMSGKPVPSALFAASDDELNILRAAMLGALQRPEHGVAIGRWIQALRGLPADSALELEPLVVLLGEARAWQPQLVVLRDTIAHGDRRDKTLMALAAALTQVGRWNEAKIELKARLADRPAADNIVLLRFMVILGRTVDDSETEEWARALKAADGKGPQEYAPPTMAAAAEQASQPRRRLLVHFENGELTIDPSIPLCEVEEQLVAAMILGFDGKKGTELRDQVAAEEPELFEKVLAYLPAYARPTSPADALLGEAEHLFTQRCYSEAITKYKAALEIDPDHQLAYLGLGDAYYMLGQYRMAIAHFSESIAIQPTPQALRFLGDAILRGQDDPHRAKECYEQALELDPDYGGARQALALVKRLLDEDDVDGR